MTKKRGKKEKKEEKLKKMMQKDVQNCMPDSKADIFLVSGAYRAGRSWWRVDEMLK